MPWKPDDYLDPHILDPRQTDRAWNRRLAEKDHGDSLAPAIRAPIDESWRRSVEAGVDPGQAKAPGAAEAAALDRLRSANQALLTAARVSVERIGRMLSGAEAVLILTDDRGVILETIGDAQTIARARKINLYVGGVWNEQAVGTNGIGTALWAGEPMFVHGHEHFVETLKDWSCAAAPVRDPVDGHVIGAVDLSGLTHIFRRHNIAFAAAAAGEIEAALARCAHEERMQLLEALARQAPAALRDTGAAILDRQGRVVHLTASGQAGEATGGLSSELHLGKRLLRLEGAITPATIEGALPKELGVKDVELLMVEGEVRGLAVMLPRCSTGRRARHLQQPTVPALYDDARHGLVIIGACEAMREAIDLARRVALVNTPVLIEGETGVGKELFARLIHTESARGRKTPYVAINCGAISRELVGGELFGHVQGAFTGATREGRPGKLELANGGVLCLDEIGEMPLDIQPYLLRVLEERVVHRIGETRERPFDGRLVALTNRDLRAEAETGRFRRDLYYRIGAVTIHVPPLRERGEDALLLLDHFNAATAREFEIEPLQVSEDARALFLTYAWPGNVRELRNLVQRLHTLSTNRRVTAADLPREMRQPGPAATATIDESGTIRDTEKAVILRAISTHDGNLSRVAEALGISRPTLYRKMRQYEIQRVFR